jgi:hypothetical protein
MLQEAGHAFGLPNSGDPSSVMYEYYQGVRGGLAEGDVAAVQSLYGGPRAADAHESWDAADPAAAADIAPPIDAPAGAALVVQGDLGGADDVDVYRFRTPAVLPTGGLSVVLAARGVSLVAPRLTVYNADQQVVGTAVAAGPAGADLVVTLTAAAADADYFVRVEAAGDAAFAAGGYRLRVVTDPAAATTVAGGAAVLDDAGTDDTADGAATLAASGSGNAHYAATAVLRGAGDADFYRIHAAAYNSSKAHLYLTVRAADAGLLPRIRVYNDQMQSVSVQVLASGNGVYMVSARNVAAGRDYFVKVSADAGSAVPAGEYTFDADCRTAYVTYDATASGELSAFQSYQFYRMTVYESQVMRFTVSAQDWWGFFSMQGVRVTIYNEHHQEVFGLTARANAGDVTDTALLTAGEYVICVVGGSMFGSTLMPLSYQLSRSTLTDPMGPLPVDSAGEDVTTCPSGVDWTPVAGDDDGLLANLFPVLRPWL